MATDDDVSAFRKEVEQRLSDIGLCGLLDAADGALFKEIRRQTATNVGYLSGLALPIPFGDLPPAALRIIELKLKGAAAPAPAPAAEYAADALEVINVCDLDDDQKLLMRARLVAKEVDPAVIVGLGANAGETFRTVLGKRRHRETEEGYLSLPVSAAKRKCDDGSNSQLGDDLDTHNKFMSGLGAREAPRNMTIGDDGLGDNTQLLHGNRPSEWSYSDEYLDELLSEDAKEPRPTDFVPQPRETSGFGKKKLGDWFDIVIKTRQKPQTTGSPALFKNFFETYTWGHLPAAPMSREAMERDPSSDVWDVVERIRRCLEDLQIVLRRDPQMCVCSVELRSQGKSLVASEWQWLRSSIARFAANGNDDIGLLGLWFHPVWDQNGARALRVERDGDSISFQVSPFLFRSQAFLLLDDFLAARQSSATARLGPACIQSFKLEFARPLPPRNASLHGRLDEHYDWVDALLAYNGVTPAIFAH
jgi:hypothetical protein